MDKYRVVSCCGMFEVQELYAVKDGKWGEEGYYITLNKYWSKTEAMTELRKLDQ